MKLNPDVILAEIPGWQGASWSELSGGLNNRTWRVTMGEKSGVLKIDEGQREAPFSSRCDEAHVQNMATKAGLAPKVILADRGFYFTEYVEGTVWTRDCLDKEGNLELIAAALRKLHALPLSGRSFDARVAAKRYAEKAEGVDAAVIKKCTEITAQMRLPQNLCCCHNDLVANNLITTPDLMLLDWEYSCDNDPFFDLATVVEHHLLSDEQVNRLLDAYLDGDGQRWRAHLNRQRKLYLALLCLWMASRPDRDLDELQTVSDRLLTNYF
jgi:thiamine kinase-like enzyme